MVEGVISFDRNDIFTMCKTDYDRAPYDVKQLMLVAGFKPCPSRLMKILPKTKQMMKNHGFLPEILIAEESIVGLYPAIITIEDERWIDLIKKESVSVMYLPYLTYKMKSAKRIIGRTYTATCFVWVSGSFFRTFSRLEIQVRLK